MKGYIIGIGGSGHRCAEALTHLAAAGLLLCNEINVMFVDSDSGNGNFDRMKKTLGDYTSINNFIGNSDSFFKTTIKPAVDLEKCLWSPLEGTDRTLALTDQNKNLNNILQQNLMSDEEKLLFNFLYTEKERTEPLIEGFYGHPSIGSALIAKNLDFSTEPWKTLVGNINKDVKNGEVRVFFIASIFGGTGASGFPTISKYLEKTIGNDRLKLGGILLLPYFRFDTARANGLEDSLCPDCGNFMAKSKAALFYYYNQKFYETFKKIYMIGDSYDEFTEMTFSRGKGEQKNKSHIVELYAAFAAANFFNTDSMPKEKICLTTRGKVKENQRAYENNIGKHRYDWERISNMLLDKDEAKNKLSQLLRFSIVFTKTYFPVIDRIAKSESKNDTRKSAPWYKLYFLDNGIDINSTKDEDYIKKLKPVYDYCSKFIDWIYDLHIRDIVGKERVRDQRVNLFNISYSNLFDKRPEDKTELENFQNLILENQKNENKSGEIYHQMCKKRKTEYQNRPFVDRFILDLYDLSELK